VTRTRPTSEAERHARAANDRCEYGPLGNRTTCGCGRCAAWRRRLALKTAALDAGVARQRAKLGAAAAAKRQPA
jgi:hypothetical protein